MGKVEHDRDICIGCGACAAVFPEGWEMADDGKANLINSKEVRQQYFERDVSGEEKEQHQDAADSCPVNCIHVKDD